MLEQKNGYYYWKYKQQKYRMSFYENSGVATKIKIIFLGDPTVGKTCLISAIRNSEVPRKHEATVGIDFFSKVVHHKSQTFKLQFWDTAGQQRFRSIIPSYVRNSQVGVIIFDVKNRHSFDRVIDWLQIFRETNNPDTQVVVVGNKIDCEDRDVLEQEARKKMDELGLRYIQTSAVTGAGVEELQEQMVKTFIFSQGEIQPALACKSYSAIQIDIQKEGGIEKQTCCRTA